MKLALLLVLSLACFIYAAAPVYPQRYFTVGTFSIPYFNISEPIELYYDAPNNRELFRYYGGMNSIWTIGNTTYSLSPIIDDLVCTVAEGYFGPLISLLVDLSSYTNMGTTTINGKVYQHYQLKEVDFNYTSTFDYYAQQDGTPYQFIINGVDFIFDSHPDIYVMKYDNYIPNFNMDAVFNVHELCRNATKVSMDEIKRGFAASVFGALQNKANQNVDHQDQFEAFISKYGKKYADGDEYTKRFGIFKDNLNHINKHNNDKTKTHKLGVNHYADMSDEEFRSIYLPKKGRSGSKATHTHKLVDTVPATMDWRTQGAVTAVKDQGVCGSCFAFGSTGSLEGVNKIATGKLLSLSEQQIVDCSWKYQNNGCDGGEASFVYDWLLANGGIALESSYPYLMQNGFCMAKDWSSGVKITGYVNVTYGESNLLNAVGSVGPVAIAIDASQPDFRFYLSGVYYNPNCANTLDDLDHEVLAVGYGTYNNQDYWLVKNSWSTHWGIDGYVMMARNRNNNCGVATQPTYPIV